MSDPVPCGGCGATEDRQRCIGCMHDFGTPDSEWVKPYLDPSLRLSKEARELCARWFQGPNNTVTSNPPHAVMGKVQPAMDELLAAGFVTKHPFNRFGVFEYRGSEKAAEIGQAYFREWLGSQSGNVE